MDRIPARIQKSKQIFGSIHRIRKHVMLQKLQSRVAYLPGPADCKNPEPGENRVVMPYVTEVPSIQIDEPFPVVIRRTKSNSPQAVGVITAGQLVKRYTVPQRDARNKRGYQRPVSMARVNKLANDLRTGRVDLPTAVLLNVRDSAEGIVEEINEAGWTMFQPNGHELF